MIQVIERHPSQVSIRQMNYMKKIKRKKYLINIVRILLLFSFLYLWEFSAKKGFIDAFFFSSPSRIYECFLFSITNDQLFMHIGISLAETLLSFLFIMLLSLVTASLLWHFKTLSNIMEPILVLLNSLPKSALAPLIIVWLGTGMKTIIVCGLSVAIFGCIINLYTSFLTSDTEKQKLIRILGGKKRHIFTMVVLPSSVPTIFSNMKVNIGLSLVGVMIGEFLAAKKGLGYLIIYASQVFELDLLIMCIVILCIIAVLLYQSLQLLEKIFVRA